MSYRFTRRTNADVCGLSANWIYADQARWIGFVLLYAVAANIPFWTASRWLDLLPLGWFCLEYAIVGVLALFVSRGVTAFLLLLVIVADIINGVCKTYYLAPSQCLGNLGTLHDLPGSRLIHVVGVFLLAVIILACAIVFPIDKIKGNCKCFAITCLLAFVAAAVSEDYAAIVHETGQRPHIFTFTGLRDSRSFTYLNSMKVARYPEVKLLRNQLAFGRDWGHTVSALNQSHLIHSASDPVLRYAELDPGSSVTQPNIVLVLTESWGLSKDSNIRDQLVRPYFQSRLLDHYSVSQGSVPFYGATVSGEGRELCRSKVGTQIINVPGHELKACLPARLAALGYRSIALHGMDGNMFHRSSWYRTIGFHEQWFHRDFQQQSVPDCLGAFTGTCDAAVADWIGHRLGAAFKPQGAGPTFAYWVTLNSHLPVPVPAGLPNPASCMLTAMLSSKAALCSWYQLVANVHESVARLAMSNLARPTVFVIVGDHAPPFAEAALRNQFSNTEVPYIVLAPLGSDRFSMRAAKIQHSRGHNGPS